MTSNKESFRKLFNNKQQLQSGEGVPNIARKAHIPNEYMSSPTEPSLLFLYFNFMETVFLKHRFCIGRI
jgi:hypothetical protein